MLHCGCAPIKVGAQVGSRPGEISRRVPARLVALGPRPLPRSCKLDLRNPHVFGAAPEGSGALPGVDRGPGRAARPLRDAGSPDRVAARAEPYRLDLLL